MRLPDPPRPIRPVLRFGSVAALAALSLLRAVAQHFPHPRLPWRVPYVGDIDGKIWAPAVVIDDPVLGRSMTLPSILEITVDGQSGTCRPALLGEPVARGLFDRAPAFRVNVAFACGKGRPLRPGLYADPRSPWFNVFTGCYQVDVPQRTWGRPFGYAPDGHGGFTVFPDDLARLGRADWHYFSNYLYGVPLKVLKAENSAVTLVSGSRVVLGERAWDQLTGERISVVSAYQSRLGDRLVDTWKVVNNLWRAAFGLPVDTDDPAASFVTTELGARLYVAWAADDTDFDMREPVYRTYVFGGTINHFWARDDLDRSAQNLAFLELQMATLAKLITTAFPHVGFDPDSPSRTPAGTAAESRGTSSEPAPPVATPEQAASMLH